MSKLARREVNKLPIENENPIGEFVSLAGERYYAIRHVDRIPPFFISLISASDHWLFVSSTGGLTAGRISPETALFPYITVDKIHDNALNTGSKTLLRVHSQDSSYLWEPFNREHDGHFNISRHLYKNTLGNKLRFEEINHDLQLAFSYSWATSESFGFARQCELKNLAGQDVSIDLLDGLQNVLPAGTPMASQTNASNLVDAYKWTELDESTGLAYFTLYSGIADRAEPSESLKANTLFCLGLESPTVLLCSEQLSRFRRGDTLHPEMLKRGVRGAYMVNTSLKLRPGTTKHWQLIADTERDQSQVIELRHKLAEPVEVNAAISDSIDRGTDRLARIVASSDGFQLTEEENVTVHHYANTLFNILRGGIFDDQYRVSSADFALTIKMFNRSIFQRHQGLLQSLPGQLEFDQLQSIIKQQEDPGLERLGLEYLPITFGRRHGDPSRPWNRFKIKLKDENGARLLSYEGNWRDIFQNWEALTFSYPEFVESVIAKFVNASTMDGYNPYRITKEGIDWEIEDPDDPWSYIGYWGDHQIIYLLKMLELSRQFHPERLDELLHQAIFCYSNVPYRIKPLNDLLRDAKSTVDYDWDSAQLIAQRVENLGADGKLVLSANDEVYQVNLLEKLLVPLLCKLGNLVVDGGIWLNTQRPEWNDANNALVGQGLSMVTLYYMRRYVCFLQTLLSNKQGSVSLTAEVNEWLKTTAMALANTRSHLGEDKVSAGLRFKSLMELGEAADRYRRTIYQQESPGAKTDLAIDNVLNLLDDALATIDHSIEANQRPDGLYHAYNLLGLDTENVKIDYLYPMLEGQVAALSSGAISPAKAISVLETLFASDMYRDDQKSFMLYPDRKLPGLLEKNRISSEQADAIPLLEQLLVFGDESILKRDEEGNYRFNAKFTNIEDLNSQLEKLVNNHGDQFKAAAEPLRKLYEQVFNHREFTGRSGGMFGFEGLGCIYWHMVAKLLLAVGEIFFAARESGADKATCEQLAKLYYRVREGLGFNKTPAEFGAFPTDPYSHTPKHAGAQQPGMTGQVKEEVLTRFVELGIRVSSGRVSFVPALLRHCEFVSGEKPFRYLDVNGDWQDIMVPSDGLAFTWCQTPVIMRLDDNAEPAITVQLDDGSQQVTTSLALGTEMSAELFRRSGRVQQLDLVVNTNQLFSG